MKKLLALLLAAIMCVSMVACNGSGEERDRRDLEEMKEETREEKSLETDEGDNISEKTEDSSPEIVEIPGVCEFYVDYMDIAKTVTPLSPNENDWYKQYEAQDGKIYIDICIAYKNLAATDREAYNIMKGILVYSGKYQYTGFSMIEEADRSNFKSAHFGSIAPLATEYLHYLFEVPEEIETSKGALTVLMNIEGEEHSIVFREGTEGDAGAPSGAEKVSGEVVDRETIAVAGDCEFYVEYCNITNDVMPPQPIVGCSHFEANPKKVYVDFCIAYKGWNTENAIAAKVISAKISYAGKSDYRRFAIIEEDSRGDLAYADRTYIAPLATEYIHYLFDMPEEVVNSSEPMTIIFTIGGNTYTYDIR